jgi:hypothetical protein
MRLAGNPNPDAYYEPNSFNGPVQDERFREPPLKISGDADRTATATTTIVSPATCSGGRPEGATVPKLQGGDARRSGRDRQAADRPLRKEAVRAGRTIKRIAVAYEAGRDGFWLARWLRAREIEAYVIHPSSVPVSREHRRKDRSARH